MPEQTMVERVARALANISAPCAIGELTPDSMVNSLTGHQPLWQVHTREARTAIIATFEAAFDSDWERLFAALDDSGHGKFWKRIFSEIHALSQTHST